MHRWLTLALIPCIVACAGPVRVATGAFRPADAPIYSSAAFDPAKLEGRWIQTAAFRADGSPDCGAGVVDFTPSGRAMVVFGKLCLNGQVTKVSGEVQSLGSGRLSVAGMANWWVLWVDSGYRTLAIGTPSGAFGFILDRGEIAADRLVAAREIFDFNGYQTSALGPT